MNDFNRPVFPGLNNSEVSEPVEVVASTPAPAFPKVREVEEEVNSAIVEVAPVVEELAESPVVPTLPKLPPMPTKKALQHSDLKPEAPIEIGEWDDDNSTDTHIGVGGEVDKDYVAPQYDKAFNLTERDFIMLKFLARYRYAYVDQIARLVDSAPKNITARLKVLEKRGLVRREVITKGQSIWLTRKAGNLVADINFNEIKKGTVSFATIAHTIGIVNLAVELEREMGGKNILGEEHHPKANRHKGGNWDDETMVYGEMTVSEREVRQGQLRWRGNRNTAEMRDIVDAAVANKSAPELLEGNEGLFVVYGMGGADGEHIPDLVVARERDENGAPVHIAIELELTPKSKPQWKRILRWYRDNGVMYSKIYYFTHKRSIATAIEDVASEVGMSDKLVVRKYIPINDKTPFWG